MLEISEREACKYFIRDEVLVDLKAKKIFLSLLLHSYFLGKSLPHAFAIKLVTLGHNTLKKLLKSL